MRCLSARLRQARPSLCLTKEAGRCGEKPVMRRGGRSKAPHHAVRAKRRGDDTRRERNEDEPARESRTAERARATSGGDGLFAMSKTPSTASVRAEAGRMPFR